MAKYSPNKSLPSYSGKGLAGILGQGYQNTPSAGYPHAKYQSRLTIQYADGSKMTYEQNLSIPLYSRGAGKSRLPLDYMVGTDGASHLDGYKHISEMLADKNIDELYRNKGNHPYLTKEEEEKTKNKTYGNFCVCGKPVQKPGELCDDCLKKTEKIGVNGGKENGKNHRNRLRYI